jgi:hypothetical protein
MSGRGKKEERRMRGWSGEGPFAVDIDKKVFHFGAQPRLD